MDCNLKRLDGETQDQYFYRVCTMKDSLGFTWPQMAEIFNNEFGCNKGDTAYRKKWAAFKSVLDANTDKIVGKDSYSNELQDQIDELYKAKVEELNAKLTRPILACAYCDRMNCIDGNKFSFSKKNVCEWTMGK